MPLILGANSVSGGYEIDNSLRFNSGSSDKLTRTTGTPTSQQKFTWSSWCKRTNIGTYNIIQGFYTDANNYLLVSFSTSDKIDIINYPNSTTARKITTQVFRDPSAWYHILVAVDTTLATATDRIKLYVNGNQVTAFATDTAPSQNANLLTNATTTAIGVGEGGSIGYYNGYISEIYYIDGQALDPSSFGETDEDTNIWKPIPYTGSFGTNGFYLEFQNSGALGTDSSGNGNTFTVNNLTSIDQTTDTPTNNFATWNPLSQGVATTSRVFTDGNTSVLFNNGDDSSLSTIGVSTGKWYAEFKATAVPTTATIGVGNESSDLVQNPGNTNIGKVVGGYGYYNLGGSNSKIINGGSFLSYGDSWTTNDIIGVALDLINGAIWFSKNGVWQSSATIGEIEAGTTTNACATGLSGTFFFGGSNSAGGTTGVAFSANFGNPPFTISSGNADANGYGNFEYAVPSGYYALCTKNLADFG